MKWKCALILFIVLCFNELVSQNLKQDSLQEVISKNLNDTNQVKAMCTLSSMVRGSDQGKATQLSRDAYSLAKKLNFKKGIGLACLNLGTINHVQGNYDTAIVYYNQALDLFTQASLKKNISRVHNNLGNLYQLRADYSKAIEHLLICKNIAEELKDDKGLADCELNIGNVYIQKKDYNKALQQYYKSLGLSKKISDSYNMAQLYNNIGATQRYLNRMDCTLINYKRSLAIRYEINDAAGIAETTLNIGDAYSNVKNYDSALVYFKKSYSLYRAINSQAGVAYSLHNMGGVLYHLQHENEALDTLKKSVSLSTQLGLRDLKLSAYNMIAEVLFNQGHYKESAEFMKTMALLKDSLLNESSNKQITEMQTKYESVKKDKEIIQQTSEIKNQQVEAQKKAIEYRALVVGFVLLLILAVFIFSGYRQKQKANMLITQQKKEVENKSLIIEEKQKEIIDSINYAKRIQYTLLAHKDFLGLNLSKNGGDHFVYFNPKDIVSGDFYWATQQGNKFYLAVCDSTGHGVPGAFMSLLNIGFLSEAINEKGISNPDEVFNFVRQRLVNAISKEGQKDGFDGILVCINTDSNEITYAAANNKPLLITNGTCTELSCDRMPVGKGENERPFNLYSQTVMPGDCVYLYTDGYADQFGGPKGKKYKYKSLNELILSNHKRSFIEQKSILQQNFDSWRGELEQVDDVCVIGIRF